MYVHVHVHVYVHVRVRLHVHVCVCGCMCFFPQIPFDVIKQSEVVGVLYMTITQLPILLSGAVFSHVHGGGA